MGGRITLAGMALRPKGRQPRAAPAKPAAEEPPRPTFLHLDVLDHVLSYLDVADLCRAACVSREWRVAAAAAQTAWRQAFVEEFGLEKAQDFVQLRSWRDKYIACLLTSTVHKLRSKARYLDELEDSAGLVEKNAQVLLGGLNQMDRTLNHRRHDLDDLLAGVSAKRGTHADSKLGKEMIALAFKGGDLQRFPRLTPDVCASVAEMAKDVEFWRNSISEERDSLHRLWDSLSYLNTCCKKVRGDIAELQRRRAELEMATLYRPTVRRT